MIKLHAVLPFLRGYDVVQLINPMFLELRAERIFSVYKYLRKHNKKVFMGAFGMDYFWVNICCTTKPLRYSDFNMGNELRDTKDAIKERKDWIGTAKERLNRYIADDCDGIVAGLYEYWACYKQVYPDKTTFIPFPVKLPEYKETKYDKRSPVKIFIGINKERSEYKGTDIMLEAALEIKHKYPDKLEIIKAESVPFDEYQNMMNGSDAILDQLYSYTPSMNPLLAMSKGIICIGGGEPENYEILGETELRPIINVLPNKESVYKELESLVLHPERIPELKRQSIEYVLRHHEYVKVARQYVEFYNK